MQAVPAAIGLGGSIFGGISGKNAAKRQEKLAREQMAQLKPLLDAQIAGAQFGLQSSKPLIGDARASLLGAGQATRDLQNFWRPLAFGSRSAIDKFLSPERRAINQGFAAQSDQLARFAPRGGGRVSAMAGANRQRQGQLSDLVFGARKEGAGQMANLANLLSSIGGTQGGVGTSLLGAGLSGGKEGFDLLGQQQNRAFAAGNAASKNWGQIGEQLGGFLKDVFDNKSGSGGGKYAPLDFFGTGADTGAGNKF